MALRNMALLFSCDVGMSEHQYSETCLEQWMNSAGNHVWLLECTVKSNVNLPLIKEDLSTPKWEEIKKN
jgi:hypothetical protein